MKSISKKIYIKYYTYITMFIAYFNNFQISLKVSYMKSDNYY